MSAEEAAEKLARLAVDVDRLDKTLQDATSRGAVPGGNEKLIEFQTVTLEKLRHLRVTLERERQEMSRVVQERDEAVAREALATNENRKNQYRIQFLLRELDRRDAEAKQ
mmetsp:Transcript_27344/g.64888  ORF Transcript_27344/g.64888 Transcript_27344/m.64888 type:complete len:110 (+) Transcript_27344:38-367(+)